MIKKYFTKEVKIAIATILAGLILFAGINFLKGINILKPTNYYYINYKNVAGLTISSPVMIDGFKVGLVRAIEYNYQQPGNVTVEISLNKQLRIPAGSKAVLNTDFLGTATIEIKLNRDNSGLHTPGDMLIGENAPDLMGSVQNKLLPQLETILPRIDTILTGIQAVVQNEALGNSLTRIDHITQNLETSTQELNGLLRTDVPQIMNNFNSISSNLDTFTGNIRDIDLKKTMSKVNATLTNLETVSGKLTSTDNTLGLLLNDNRLYYGLTSTVQNADSLLLDLRLHPKRYVHFSLFGRK